MDDYLSLRSLEGSGRPFGTERPSPSSERTHERPERADQARFDRSKRAESEADSRTRRSESRDAEERFSNRRDKEHDFSRELRQAEAKQHTGPRSTHDTDLTQPARASVAVKAEGAPRNDREHEAEAPRQESAPQPALDLDAAPPQAPPSLPLREQVSPAKDSAPTELEDALSPFTSQLSPAALPLELSRVPAISPLANSTARTTWSTQSEVPGEPLAEAGADALKSAVQLAPGNEFGTSTSDGNTGSLDGNDPQSAAGANVETKVQPFEAALAQAADKPVSPSPADLAKTESVLRQFKVELHPKLDHALIQLHPAELGRIEVRIEVERGRLRAVLRADSAETLDLLERHVPELRAALAGSGLEAESFEFGLGLEQENKSSQEERSGGPLRTEPEALLEGFAKREIAQRIVSESRVDTYA